MASQVGGNHYSRYKIEPRHIFDEYNLNPYEAFALKYLLRYRHKGGKLDILKCIHNLMFILEKEYGTGSDFYCGSVHIGVEDPE